MYTPNKDQIGTPVSRFEDSPVFNYINSLSPIKPVKSLNTAQILTPLSSASPPPVFASPHIISHRESGFLRRHLISVASKPEFTHIISEEKAKERFSNAEPSDLCVENLRHLSPERSCKSFTNEQPYDSLKSSSQALKDLKYHKVSLYNDAVHCDFFKTDTMPEMAETPASLVQDVSEEKHHPSESETELCGIHNIERNKEILRCDWENVISSAANLLISDGSNVGEQSEGQDQEITDTGVISFISAILELPQDDINDLQKLHSAGSVGSLEHKMEESATQLEVQKLEETDQMPVIPSSTVPFRIVGNDSSNEVNDKWENCNQSNFTKQLSIRRRCLVFESAGPKKQSLHDPDSSFSLLSQCNCRDATNENQLTSLQPRNGYSSPPLSGIGLHLNALGTSSKDGVVVKHETWASERQPISIPSSVSSFKSSCSGKNLQGRFWDSVPNENEIQAKEDASQTSMWEDGEQFENSSPKRKRQRLEHDGGSEACKRCNCKKTKCLKLYCDCFAAGLYCVEPCSCIDCFNKPVHEEIVLETRKLIEARNPLAFAPKVTRNIDPLQDYGDDSNKTPASAHHKRGCNCKKSSCLKKYCECFQGGVGCSISCRCEGCKNSFGRKNGVDDAEIEGEESEAYDPSELDTSSNNTIIHKVKEEHKDDAFPITPEIGRGKSLQSSSCAVGSTPCLSTSRKLRTSSVPSRQSRFQKYLQMIPEDSTSEIPADNSALASDVKSTSPNCKRVSYPHCELGSPVIRGRKLILRSIPSFPSLIPHRDSSDLLEKHP